MSPSTVAAAALTTNQTDGSILGALIVGGLLVLLINRGGIGRGGKKMTRCCRWYVPAWTGPGSPQGPVPAPDPWPPLRPVNPRPPVNVPPPPWPPKIEGGES